MTEWWAVCTLPYSFDLESGGLSSLAVLCGFVVRKSLTWLRTMEVCQLQERHKISQSLELFIWTSRIAVFTTRTSEAAREIILEKS